MPTVRIRAAFLLLLCAPVLAHAARSLAEIEERMRTQQQAIEAGKASLDDVNEWMEDAAQREGVLAQARREAERAIRGLREKQRQYDAERIHAEQRSSELRADAQRTIAPILAAGEGGILKVLFGRTEFEDIVVSDLVMRQWMDDATVAVGRYAEAAVKASVARGKLDAAVRELADRQNEVKVAMAEIARGRTEQATVQKKLREDLKLREASLRALEDEASRLRDLIQKRGSGGKGRDMPTIRTSITPGRPAVLRGFGPYKDRATGLSLQSTGVVLFAESGTPIFAAADGQVVFADWFRGYGWLVILEHGGGYYSLYGHCSELEATVGSEVKRGQRVALSGASGSLDGPSIYFEVRKGTTPVDPIRWVGSAD